MVVAVVIVVVVFVRYGQVRYVRDAKPSASERQVVSGVQDRVGQIGELIFLFFYSDCPPSPPANPEKD